MWLAPLLTLPYCPAWITPVHKRSPPHPRIPTQLRVQRPVQPARQAFPTHLHAKCTVQPRKRSGRGALDVVVEHEVVVAVAVKQRARVRDREVLKLQHRERPACHHGAHKLVHQVVVRLARCALAAEAEVVGVVEQVLVVGAHVQHNWEDLHS
eukprot:366074-Chlamydomonas_euryale.AAC.13